MTIEQLRAASVDLSGAVPIAASSPAQSGISESGFRRFLLVLAGAGMILWGVALVGLDLGAVKGVAGIGGRVVGKLVK